MANLFGGLFNNYSEVSAQELQQQYGHYLMPQEKIRMGFKLVRDTFIVTDERIIFIDHQGVTGKSCGSGTVLCAEVTTTATRTPA